MTSRPTTPGGASNVGNSSGLGNYQLGDSLGKGAFAQVFRALNWTTGETVAIKQIELANIPKGDLGEIMAEIDLLKNLNHTNIVQYKGFVKTKDFLNIILEYCENGSLSGICKRFGKFPENLVAVYISQVLEGLVYLHDQGVIHRDIKGANILTNKDGTVKLADFGVATAQVSDGTVVGSPYWMAPEVIEQLGATTASDIWSLGCVVIELLEGKPPYHFLPPMPALFRIVQDDCPPIPDGASPIVKDFLYHCFQKDCNLRISAKKLLRHPWMVSAKKQLVEQRMNATRVGRPAPNYNYDEAVQRVQEWNEALKSPSRPTVAKGHIRQRPVSPTPSPPDPSQAGWKLMNPNPNAMPIGAALPLIRDNVPPPTQLQPEEQTDNWDDDFEEEISLTKIQALDKSISDEDKTEELHTRTIRPTKSPSAGPSPLSKPPPTSMSAIMEDYSDLLGDEEEEILVHKLESFKAKTSSRRGLIFPSDIHTVGLTGGSETSPAPRTAPLPFMSPLPSPPNTMLRRKTSFQSSSKPKSTTPPSTHSRTSSFVGLGFSTSSTGSAGSSGGSNGHGSHETTKTAVNLTELDRFTEDENEDYDDIFGRIGVSASGQSIQTLQLNTRYSSKSWLGDHDSDEEDPFAEIEEDFVEEDLEANLQRDKHARLCATVNQLVADLVPNAPDSALKDTCEELLALLAEAPDMQDQLVNAHGMLAILEVLESKPNRDVIIRLLQIIHVLVTADLGVLESFCLIGGIPVLMEFTSKKYSSECRLGASNAIRLLCHTSVLTLQMFISCRGLKVLVDILDEDFIDNADLVSHSLNGISSVFELQSPTPKNDFCRMFIREGLLDPLSSALINVTSAKGNPKATDMKAKILNIVFVFCQVSQSDAYVRNAIGTRKIVRRLLRGCELLEPEHLVVLLKAIKHLSMSQQLLDVLQNANAIEILVNILEAQDVGSHSAEIQNHVFQTCYNLCRLNKGRQEEAAQAGIIPCLKRVIETNSPLKQFALPILCDLANAGKACRMLLWQNDGLGMYLQLLIDPYFQVSAMEAVLAWLQDDTARVQDVLAAPSNVSMLLKCFTQAKANSFENLLDPLLKILRLSQPNLIVSFAKSEFFKRITDRLGHNKAVVRLNLLRILRAVCDVHPDRATLVERFGLYEVVEKLSKNDGAVLVKELARDILPVLRPGGGALKLERERSNTTIDRFQTSTPKPHTPSSSTSSMRRQGSSTRPAIASRGGIPASFLSGNVSSGSETPRVGVSVLAPRKKPYRRAASEASFNAFQPPVRSPIDTQPHPLPSQPSGITPIRRVRPIAPRRSFTEERNGYINDSGSSSAETGRRRLL